MGAECKMNMPDVVILKDTNEFSSHIAKVFLGLLVQEQRNRSNVSVVVSGGNTPILVNEKIVELSNKTQLVDWNKVEIFFSDERCVNENHIDSNYRMINDTLIKPLQIPIHNVYRIKCEKDPAVAAEEYEDVVREYFQRRGRPTFDIALLGIGIDGHVASLFPGDPALYVENHLVVATKHKHIGRWRVTLTYPALSNIKNILFMVRGKDKRNALKNILSGDCGFEHFPACGVRQPVGSLTYYIEKNTL